MLLEGAIRRIPFLKDAGIIDITCHPGAYTPDCQPMLGPLPGVRGMWMQAGMSLNGYGGGGGVGKLMAEWSVEGEASRDGDAYRGQRFGNSFPGPEWGAGRSRGSLNDYLAVCFHNE